jgi:hypothetical protein
MGKKVTRHRPHIQAEQLQHRDAKDEHVQCAGRGCTNIVARWTRERFCSRCKTN